MTSVQPGIRLGADVGGTFADEVARDVRDDKVSLAAARELYGVVLDEDTLAMDLDATVTLRNRRVSSRSQ